MRVRTLAVAGALLIGVVGPVSRVGAQSVVDQATGGPPTTVVGADPTTTANFGISLVGHSDLGSRGNNSALALAGNCAYVGNRGFNEDATSTHVSDHAPVAIVDISDPTSPVMLAHGVPGTDLNTVTTREIRAVPDKHLLVVMTYERYTDSNAEQTGVSTLLLYDISDCQNPVQVGVYDFHPLKPHEFYLWEDPGHPGRVLAYVTTPFGPVQLEVLDLTDPTKPTMIATWDGLYPQPSAQEVDNSGLGNYLHSLSLSPDGTTAYLAYWDAGYYTLDTSSVARGDAHPVLASSILAQQVLGQGVNYTLRTNGNTHSAVPVPGRAVTILTDEQYDGVGECPYGWLHVVDRSNSANPVIASEYQLPQNSQQWCNANVKRTYTLPIAAEGQVSSGWVSPHDATYSSHNLTVTQNLAVVAWHAGGLQIIDTSNPSQPQQVGQYVPTPIPCAATSSASITGCAAPVPAALQQYFGNNGVLMWSYPVIRNGLIYVVDIRNGLYVLRYTGPHADELSVPMLEGNSNVSSPLVVHATVAPVGLPHVVQFLTENPHLAQRVYQFGVPKNAPLFCQI